MAEKNPDQGIIQATTLTQALTADSDELFQLVLALQPEILLALLKNPQLKDEHLVTLLKRRDLAEEIPDRIYRRKNQSLSHELLLALVKNPSTSGTIIRNLLPQLRLFELVDLCFQPGVTPDQRIAAERAIIQRLPTTPLGNKITLARRATAVVIAELLKEGDPRLVEICLTSPRLKEAAVYQFLTGPRANAETISLVARSSRWQQRPNIRLAILKNSKAPPVWFTLWLPKLSLPLLKQLAQTRKLNPLQTKLLAEELKRRC